jgi:alpha-tubulin suppressor-like RCC1 family protein
MYKINWVSIYLKRIFTVALVTATILVSFYNLPVNAANPTVTSISPTNGSIAGGTSITINGTNFSNSIAVTQVVAGTSHTCALLITGAVRCWGLASSGQLGYSNTTAIGDNETPASAGDVNVGGTVTQLTAGANHTCALLTTGNVRCWGLASSGQLGYSNTTTIGDNETPASAGDVNVGGTVTQVAAGNTHTCALLTTGKVRCWGFATSGQLGYSNTTTIGDNETPASAGDVNVGGTVTQIVASSFHTCALLTTGNVRCWGAASSGQLGYSNTNAIGDNETPASAGDVNVGSTVTQVVTGGSHTCALLTGGTVRCWGLASSGQLGYSNTTAIGDNETPASAGDVNVGSTVTQIAAGSNYTCALLTTGNVRCWGLGTSGRLGYANTTTIGDNETPASAGDVTVGGTVTQISAGAGGSHTCALLSTGNVRCWGLASSGQLGYSNTTAIGDNETPASAGDVTIVATTPTVTLGGTSATSIVYVNSTQLTAVTPAHTVGQVNVVVTNPDTTTVTFSNSYTYTGPIVGGDITSASCVPNSGAAPLTATCTANFSLGHTGTIAFSTSPDIGSCTTSAITITDTSSSCTISATGIGSSTPVTATGSGGGTASAGTLSPTGSLPNTPVITSPTSNQYINTTTPTIIGTGTTGTTIAIKNGTTTICTTTVDGSSNYSCLLSTPLSQGAYTFSVTQQDTTTNLISNPATVTITVDSINPTTPVISSPLNSLTTSSTPTITGLGEANTTITITDQSSNTLCTATVASDGTWSCVSATLTNNSYTITAKASDQALNQSPVSTSITFNVLKITTVTPNNGDVAGNTSVSVSGNGFINSTTVNQVAASTDHTCALLTTGSVRCWGLGSSGQLGYSNTNTIGDNETPASAGDVNVGGTVTQIAAGYGHTCALLTTGNVRCWGSGFAGKLGYGNTNNIGDNETPASAGDVNVGGTVTQIVAGFSHTCALLTTGNVRCWGLGSLGQLGYGNTNAIGDNETPASAGNVNVGGTVTQIAAGNSYTCALLTTGSVRCWGSASSGQLGYSNTNNIGDNETPASAGDVNVGGTVTQISLGGFHTCALLTTGSVRCWGSASSGQLGYGNTNTIGDNETPASAGDVSVGGTVTQISAGTNQTCALLTG